MSVYEEEEMIQCIFSWKIVNFRYCPVNKGQYLASPEFVLDTMAKPKWYLLLYPRGYENGNFIGLFLYRNPPDRQIRSVVDYDFAIISADGSEKHLGFKQNQLFYSKSASSGYSNFLSRDIIFNERSIYLPQDTMTIRCRMWIKTTGCSKIRRYFALTRIAVARRSIIWSISDFNTLVTDQESVFRVNSHHTLHFKLKLGTENGNEEVQIEISQVDTKMQNFSTCQIYAIDSKGNPISSAKSEYLFLAKSGIQTWSFPPFLSKTELTNGKNSLPGGALFLRCMCTISAAVVIEEFDDHGPFIFQERSTLQAEFENPGAADGSSERSSTSLIHTIQSIYNDGFLRDFFLKAEGQTFPVHRILCDRSPVFNAMFTTEMRGGKSANVVDITDVDANTLLRMLLFEYQDLLDDLEWNEVSKLYFAASKYALLTLKQRCSSLLKARMTTSNVCEILALADTHQDVELTETVQGYILTHDNEVFNSEEWKSFMKTNLQLAAKTMHLKLTKR